MRARYSVSSTGVLVHQVLDNPRSVLRWYDRSGRAQGTVGPAEHISNHRLSPDVSRVVIDAADNPKGGRSVWLVDVASGNRSRVTFGERFGRSAPPAAHSCSTSRAMAGASWSGSRPRRPIRRRRCT
ncbi:MAG: hypothetical protein AB7H93_04160 [Vicinamibacterales bacterium]